MASLRRALLVFLPIAFACGPGAVSVGSTTAGQGGDALAVTQTSSPVIINEVLANEPGSQTSAEFVELVNTGSSAVDLSGWTISDSSATRHVFASGTVLDAGAAYVVFGGASGIPGGLSNAVAASTGSLSLGNSGDTVTLKDGSGAVMGSVQYSSALSSTDGVSMNRDPDGSAGGDFTLHTNLSSAQSSPGTRVDGSPFEGSGGGTGGTDAGTGGGTGSANVFLNEILANEPGSSTGAEFVELVNSGTADADLSGWTISDAVGVRHTFAGGTVLGAGQALAVFGNASGIPAGLANAVASSTGTLSLNNGGDTVTLKDASGATVDQEQYDSSLASQDGVSMNRDPDGAAGGAWVLHTTLSSASASPGTRVDGSAFDGAGGGATDGGTGGTDGGTGGTDGGTGGIDGGTGGTDGGTGGTDGGTGSTHLRLMAANLSSGNYQSYDSPNTDGCPSSGYGDGEGERIFQGVHPDVVMIQEFNYFGCDDANSEADVRHFVDTAFGTSFYYFRQQGVQIPNGVISRYPILDAGAWADTQVSNRSFVWARIDIPGPHDLWAISVHLLTKGSTYRATEATELVNDIKANVPAGDYVVLAGDFNTGSRTEQAITTLSQVLDTSAPYPADGSGNGNTNSSRNNPYDWVLVNGGLRSYQVPVVIGSDTFSGGLVFDSRVYNPLSEVAPVKQGDSGAVNMQHMGVVKDFVLPY